MLKSKDIKDYVKVNIGELREDVEITFDILLFFPSNKHILLWKPNGANLSPAFLKKYKDRGIRNIYVHETDKEAYDRYVRGEDLEIETRVAKEVKFEEAEENAKDDKGAGDSADLGDLDVGDGGSDSSKDDNKESDEHGWEEIDKKDDCETPAGEIIAKIMRAKKLQHEETELLVSRVAKEVVEDLFDEDREEESLQKARDTVEDVLLHLEDGDPLIASLWRAASLDPDLDHGLNVATFAITFAMAMGKTDTMALTNIAISALIHDVGQSQLSGAVTRVPWKKMTEEEEFIYSAHVPEGIKLVKQYGGELPGSIRRALGGHHEKVDGTGYPEGKGESEIGEFAGYLALADLLESISSGRWDGKSRKRVDAYRVIEEQESSGGPHYVSKELFDALQGWFRARRGEPATAAA